MQTIQLQVKDNYAKNILEILENLKGVMIESVEIQKDKNLEYDPYFYERKAQLDKTIEAVDNGTMEMYDFNESVDALIHKLEQ
ncbi:hypothetical protein [Sulfurimonas sp.]|uniref:hypothetical protein n=1 Tax=Sulfurimonas sp. TaxID=2022749 RepID=UPI00260E1214|nr:hypothetical protein [Sulfurimonas sp.]